MFFLARLNRPPGTNVPRMRNIPFHIARVHYSCRKGMTAVIGCPAEEALRIV